MRSWKLAVVLTGQVAFFVSLPFLLQANNIDTLGLPAFGWAVGWLFAFAAVGTAARAIGAEERRFAQTPLGKYLPVDIAHQSLRAPEQLTLKGEKEQIYVKLGRASWRDRVCTTVEITVAAVSLKKKQRT